MRLSSVFLIAAITLITGSHGLPATTPNNQVQLLAVSEPDTASSVRSRLSESDGDGANKLRGADNTEGQDEERGIFSNAKLKLLLNLGFKPQTANKYLSKRQLQNVA
ncbi:hypothetical protein L915_06695 [Phytophthora nicotianae]|uniref:RxLR effector protein n=1 Tax=Phytophthora nicotianae TaxID=4792 RepID=W2H3T0_PHYNI|nr:hypothetical protein L915_06695 [Phytophthora nicotianae]ETL42566.1 hypothetical protein L916_06634 [Phytophthora nicotianae]